MIESVKKILRPIVRHFFASRIWLYYVGPTANIINLFGYYSVIVLTTNAYYFARRILYIHRYRICGKKYIFARKTSDTIFVFGSGASLNEMTESEWEKIQSHNTIGCNYFVHQRWIRPDFELVDSLDRCGGFLRPNRIRNKRPTVPLSKFKAEARRYGDILRENDKFADTIFFIPFDFFNKSAVMLLSGPYLPNGLRICPMKMRYNGFKNDGMRSGPPKSPTERFPGGLSGAVAIAAAYGWKNIVLVGVDLYDSRYFYLPPDETRTKHGDPEATHPNVAAGRIPWVLNWANELEQEGRKLYVYNPKSLLADHIDVFSWNDLDIQGPQATGDPVAQQA